MSTETERDWTTRAGLRAVVLMTSMGHRCGYVGLPPGHPLHGVGYSDEHPAIGFDEDEITVGKKSPILALTAGVGASRGTIRRSPDVAFDVHGGITFSGGKNGYPAEGDEWWFGFDCAHLGDRTPHSPEGQRRTLNYVAEECERLAAQIVETVPHATEATP